MRPGAVNLTAPGRLPLFCYVAVVAVGFAFWESDHFNAREHAVFDGDGCDVARIICVDEEDAALVPEVFAIFFAGFNAQFQILSSHFEDPFFCVSINILKRLSEGCQQEICCARNDPKGQGKLTVEA
jgi:hypothetical protein